MWHFIGFSLLITFFSFVFVHYLNSKLHFIIFTSFPIQGSPKLVIVLPLKCVTPSVHIHPFLNSLHINTTTFPMSECLPGTTLQNIWGSFTVNLHSVLHKLWQIASQIRWSWSWQYLATPVWSYIIWLRKSVLAFPYGGKRCVMYCVTVLC